MPSVNREEHASKFEYDMARGSGNILVVLLTKGLKMRCRITDPQGQGHVGIEVDSFPISVLSVLLQDTGVP